MRMHVCVGVCACICVCECICTQKQDEGPEVDEVVAGRMRCEFVSVNQETCLASSVVFLLFSSVVVVVAVFFPPVQVPASLFCKPSPAFFSAWRGGVQVHALPCLLVASSLPLEAHAAFPLAPPYFLPYAVFRQLYLCSL